MNYLTDSEVEAFATFNNCDNTYARNVERAVLLNEWEPGDDVDMDDSVRRLALFLLEKRVAA